MIIVGIFSWWYGQGFRLRLKRIADQLMSSYDYFSIDLLIKTWFAPFRQISAGRVNGPVAVQFRAFTDRLFSRIIGFFVRSVMIILGTIWLLINGAIGLGKIVVWLLTPVLPIVGLVLALNGVNLPWTL